MRNSKQHIPGWYTEQYRDAEAAIYCSPMCVAVGNMQNSK